MTFKIAIALTAACALAGCLQNQANQTVSAFNYQAKPGFDTNRVIGSEQVKIAASTTESRGALSYGRPVPGSSCVAESQEIIARFTTPATVTLPTIKGQPSPLTITCSGEGFTGRTVATPMLIESNASGNSVFSQDNIVAGIVVGAIGAARERAEARRNDLWRYVEVSTGVSMN